MTLYIEVHMEGLLLYVDSMPVEHRQYILGVLNGEVRREEKERLAPSTVKPYIVRLRVSIGAEAP